LASKNSAQPLIRRDQLPPFRATILPHVFANVKRIKEQRYRSNCSRNRPPRRYEISLRSTAEPYVLEGCLVTTIVDRVLPQREIDALDYSIAAAFMLNQFAQ
jgi:hypothetical protein